MSGAREHRNEGSVSVQFVVMCLMMCPVFGLGVVRLFSNV